MTFGCHLRLRPLDSAPLIRTVEARRTLARVVFERGRDFDLTCFSAAESHLHAHNGGSEEQTRELGRRLSISLTRRQPGVIGFYPSYVEPVRDESHLYSTCRYILRQDKRHDLRLDPLREASNLPDLLGLRVLGRYTAATVQRWLPSLHGRELLGMLKVETLSPVAPELQRTITAGLVATGLCSLTPRSDEHHQLKRALVQLLTPSFPTTQIAAAMTLNPRTVRRLRESASSDRELLRAIRRQDSLLVAKTEALSLLEAPLSMT
jgi:hypothetical protein